MNSVTDGQTSGTIFTRNGMTTVTSIQGTLKYKRTIGGKLKVIAIDDARGYVTVGGSSSHYTYPV